ncbi:MAG: ribosome maturation factor RimP [Bacilli bacterium]
MENKLKEIENAITGPMNDMNIIVDSVNYETEGSINFLRIVLDKVNGIDLDTIVEATNVINPIIDTFDFIDESYILDIVSKERGDE